MTTPPKRILIAKYHTPTARFRVHLLPDALEIEERAYHLRRHRVLLEEAQSLTLHSGRHVFQPLLSLLIAVTTGVVSWGLFAVQSTVAPMVMACISLGALGAAVAYTFIPSHTVTLTGRRSRGVIRFGPSRSRAEHWFGELRRNIETIQESARQEVAAQNTAILQAGVDVGSLPMPPAAATLAPEPPRPTLEVTSSEDAATRVPAAPQLPSAPSTPPLAADRPTPPMDVPDPSKD